MFFFYFKVFYLKWGLGTVLTQWNLGFNLEILGMYLIASHNQNFFIYLKFQVNKTTSRLIKNGNSVDFEWSRSQFFFKLLLDPQ